MSEKTIAFQGEVGAYSEAAAFEFYGSESETIPCDTFEKVFDKVYKEASDFGIIPIENSLAGSIHQNYDYLLDWDLSIVGEYYHRVNHCLMALPGVSMEDIKKIHSHPQALAQCREKINSYGFEVVPEKDTAGSARWIQETHDYYSAALASKRAAKVYGLNILMEGMEDNPANYTRFLALSKTPTKLMEEDPSKYKTSIAFSVENKPGSLYKALQVFADNKVNLTKIESRPIAGKPWEYMFYIDFSGHVFAKDCEKSLAHLKDTASFLRVLGSYLSHEYDFS